MSFMHHILQVLFYRLIHKQMMEEQVLDQQELLIYHNIKKNNGVLKGLILFRMCYPLKNLRKMEEYQVLMEEQRELIQGFRVQP